MVKMFAKISLMFLVLTIWFGAETVTGQTRYWIGGKPCGISGRGMSRELWRAVATGQRDAVERLLKRGADPNLHDDCGIPMLDYAAWYGQTAIIRDLVAAGADLSSSGWNNRTVLQALLQTTSENPVPAPIVEVFGELIRAGAKVNQVGNSADPVIFDALEIGDPAIVRLLIDAGLNADLRGYEGLTPYSVAAINGQLEIKQLLLMAGAVPGADVKEYYEKYGRNAFFQATSDGRTDVVEAMIASGVWPDSVNAGGMTALMYTTRRSTVDSLLAAGATVDLRDKSGFTALIWASAFGHTEIVERLLAGGADPTLENNDGLTAIDLARNASSKILLRNALRANSIDGL